MRCCSASVKALLATRLDRMRPISAARCSVLMPAGSDGPDRGAGAVRDGLGIDLAGGRARRGADGLRRAPDGAGSRADDGGGGAADQVADQHRRKKESDRPHADAVQHGVRAVGRAGQPPRRVAAHREAEEVGHKQPKAGADAEGGGGRRVAAHRVDRRRAHRDAEDVEHQADRHRDHGAGQDGAPGHPGMAGQARPRAWRRAPSRGRRPGWWPRPRRKGLWECVPACCSFQGRSAVVAGRRAIGFEGAARFHRSARFSLGLARPCVRAPNLRSAETGPPLPAAERVPRKPVKARRVPCAVRGDTERGMCPRRPEPTPGRPGEGSP